MIHYITHSIDARFTLHTASKSDGGGVVADHDLAGFATLREAERAFEARVPYKGEVVSIREWGKEVQAKIVCPDCGDQIGHGDPCPRCLGCYDQE